MNLKRFSMHFAALICAGALTVALLPGEASAQGFDLQQFNPMPNPGQNVFSGASADVAPHMEWSAFVLFNYANDPLVLENEQGDRVQSVVEHSGTVHLLGSVGLFDRLEIGIDVPVIVWQDGDAVPGGAVSPADAGFGIGDLRLVPKVQLFSTRDNPEQTGVALAVLADVYLPTGDEDRLQGGDLRAGGRLAFDAVVGGPKIVANVGYLWRSGTSVNNLTVDDTLGWHLGFEVPVDAFRFGIEGFGKITPVADSIEVEDSPTEIVGGIKYQVGRFLVTVGGGTGLVGGYGTPDFRTFAGIGLVPPAWEPEPEPQPEPAPEPEPEPECRDASVKTDCQAVPPTTCDGGVLRTYAAACQSGACAYPVTETRCASGTVCGEDEGVAACVPAPQCEVDTDCDEAPQPTCEDGVLTTYQGQCSDRSCGYVSSEETCAEGYECGLTRGVPACVEKVELAEVDEETQQIVIKEIVYFATNSDEIQQRSFNLLNQVAQLLENNPQISRVRIEGHTDSRGSRDHNMDLSQRRAESVRTYLMGRGIDGGKLRAQGFGPDRPVEDNSTASGRAANRRVEFHIED